MASTFGLWAPTLWVWAWAREKKESPCQSVYITAKVFIFISRPLGNHFKSNTEIKKTMFKFAPEKFKWFLSLSVAKCESGQVVYPVCTLDSLCVRWHLTVIFAVRILKVAPKQWKVMVLSCVWISGQHQWEKNKKRKRKIKRPKGNRKMDDGEGRKGRKRQEVEIRTFYTPFRDPVSKKSKK